MFKIQLKHIIVIVLLALIALTAGYTKFKINTSVWGPSPSMQQYPQVTEGLLWMKTNLPDQTKVFTFEDKGKLLGFNMWQCYWCQDEVKLKTQFLNASPVDVAAFMRSKNYSYLWMSNWYGETFGWNMTAAKVHQYADTGMFNPIFQNEQMILLEIPQ